MNCFKIGDECYMSNFSDDNKNYVVVVDRPNNNKFLQKIYCINLSILGAELQNARNLYKICERYQIFALLNQKTFKKLQDKMMPSNNLTMSLMALFEITGDID